MEGRSPKTAPSKVAANIEGTLPATRLLLTSCGTLFDGSTQPVSFSSDAAGATVLVNGMPLGETPMQSTLPGDQTQTFEFRLDGYDPRVVVPNSSLRRYG